MTGCVLRAQGDSFTPETFLGESSFTVCNVFHKGDRKSESRRWETSGLTALVSDSDDFAQQVTDAIDFLKSNGPELRRLQVSVGLDALSLDFGVNGKNAFLQSHLFPPELISLAAEYSMALEVSIYGS
jgi:phosphatidate phosphatase PAH1